MTGYYVSIETDVSQVQKVMDQLESRANAAGLMTYLQTIADPFIRNRIDQRFSGEGDDVSGKWHPLARSTALIRAHYGHPPDHPINKRTGELHSALVGRDADVKATGIGATLTHPAPGSLSPNTLKKLKTAQSGSSHPPTKPRPVIGVNQNDLLFLTSSLTAYLLDGMI